MFLILSIILGGIWGSFANVCIYRLPINESIAVNRSYCPQCKKKISWFDNIPLLSFFILGGKCRGCKSKIDNKYFVVGVTIYNSFDRVINKGCR